MRQLRLVGAAVIALTASSALAADLAVAPVYKAGPPPRALVYNWTGCYVGAQVGYAWQRDRDNETFTANGGGSPFSPAPTNIAQPDGVKAGGYTGCNWQTDNPLVLGIEGDAEYANLKGSATFPNTPDFYESRTNFQASLRGRIGYAVDRALLYATGGLAWANIKERDIAGTTGLTNEISTTRTGWTVGAGLEYAFGDRWLGRVEYRYSDFGTLQYQPAVFPRFTENHRVTENAIRVGLSYKFVGPVPVVARY
jgi:outer membrane immunogenic protein